MNITQLSTSSCSTVYLVDNYVVRLWIITGGTPALSFEDYSFEKRFSVVKKWDNSHWIARHPCHYDHQDISKIQGPTFEVLPQGIKDIETFMEENLPKKRLRDSRFAALPVQRTICSSNIRDCEEHTLVHCELDLKSHYISPVTLSSRVYCGRCDNRAIWEKFPIWWQKSRQILNELFDKDARWETLTSEEFSMICEHLKEWKRSAN